MTLGFNVIGYLSGNLGQGVLARNIATLLSKKNFPLSIYDLPSYSERIKSSPFEPYFVKSVGDLPFRTNLYIAPPPTLLWLVTQWPELITRNDRLNVAYSLWELTVLPMNWKRTLQLFDAIVACSEFNRHVFASNLTNVHVISDRPPIYIPSDILSCRERFKLPHDKVIFVCSFDPSSDEVRKNPNGSIEAFRNACVSDSRALLIVKINNAFMNGRIHPIVRKLQEQCQGDSRIRLVTDSLSYEDVLRLYASCDVFLSLHRAEGLGLGPMEAMALGKPVVATAWSGNMSFMDHTNSCPVRYELIPVEAKIQYYQKKFLGAQAVWANPNLVDACAWIRKLVDDPTLRTTIGMKAEEDIRHYHAEAERGRFIQEIEAIWNSGVFIPRNAENRCDEMERLRVAVARKHASVPKRIARRARELLDRHIVRRFHL